MPGLSGRMSTVIKAKISKLLDRAEDPAETLDYSYQKQIELLQNVKKGIADVVTSKKRLQLQEEKLKQQVVKLDTQARQALAAGNEELARTALERKNVVQTELQSLDTQITQLEQQQEQMTASEAKLRTKLEQFRSKKEVIKAQYSAAEAQVKINSTFADFHKFTRRPILQMHVTDARLVLQRYSSAVRPLARCARHQGTAWFSWFR